MHFCPLYCHCGVQVAMCPCHPGDTCVTMSTAMNLTLAACRGGLDMGGACSSGLASDGSRWSKLEPEQRGQGEYTGRELGQAQCG